MTKCTQESPVIKTLIYQISMGQCKKDVTPLLAHWCYVFLALTHGYGLQCLSFSGRPYFQIQFLKSRYLCYIQLNAVITQSNIWFCIWYKNDWGKICIRGYILKRHSHTTPSWVSYGVFIVRIWVKIDHVIMAPHHMWQICSVGNIMAHRPSRTWG